MRGYVYKIMNRKPPYFKTSSTDPLPLKAVAKRRVRFEEVDMLCIAWHGRYVSFLDDGRVAFGKEYGLSYQAFIDARIAAPIVQLHIDYKSPLRFDELMTIETTASWTDALKLDFEYRIAGQDGRTAATGYTVQLLTDANGNLLLLPPPLIADFRQRWQSGEFYNRPSV